MGWRGFASTVAAAAMVLFAGCTITHGGTMVDLVSSNHHFQWSSLGDVIEGYVYVPQSDPGIKLTVGEYVFPSADGAPDGWVPAVGAAVTVDLGGDLVPVTARTDARGYFSFSVGSGGGVIVNIASIAGHNIPLPNRASYVASKAGLIGFTRECAREFAAYGIRVNAVCPGVIETEMTAESRSNPAQLEKWLADIPQGRLGQPADVAGLVLFLCSDSAAYLTGQAINVDGGKVML